MGWKPPVYRDPGPRAQSSVMPHTHRHTPSPFCHTGHSAPNPPEFCLGIWIQHHRASGGVGGPLSLGARSGPCSTPTTLCSTPPTLCRTPSTLCSTLHVPLVHPLSARSGLACPLPPHTSGLGAAPWTAANPTAIECWRTWPRHRFLSSPRGVKGVLVHCSHRKHNAGKRTLGNMR